MFFNDAKWKYDEKKNNMGKMLFIRRNSVLIRMEKVRVTEKGLAGAVGVWEHGRGSVWHMAMKFAMQMSNDT